MIIKWLSQERKAAAAEEKAALGDAAFSAKYAKKIKKCDKENKDSEPASHKGAKKIIKKQADAADAQESKGADTVQVWLVSSFLMSSI